MSSTNEGARPTASPAVSVRSVATAVPPTALEQGAVRDLFADQPDISPLARRLIRSVFNSSAIERRYTPIGELAGRADADTSSPPTFYDATTGTILTPSTGVRNAEYERSIRPLLRDAAERALAAAPELDRADITHVVTVSCTGFFAPGPDYVLVRDLGLAPSTRRLHIGFMGCYGAFPALRAARSTCIAEPDATVLVVCAELCSLHLRSSDDPDAIVASSVFGDGAAAAIVTARPVPAGATVLEMDALETVLTDDGEADMAWTIGDLGFEMVLSSYVPRILEARIAEALRPLLEAGTGARDAAAWSGIERWAVHPGGRAILDRVQRALGLSDEQLAPSRDVLRDYGNMSSATVLFILERLLRSDDAETGGGADPAPERVAAMAFGPGLTVESALFTKRVMR
ncbi:naringenin-chalcone synthase [Pseudoclavibacter endophyticus]|uniref:Type III polyketide synthase n=1 Tax=Pseudoclavibacter endophyticus TaxID=1778590 RepID=A0A6H9WEW6_9MICO|nr:type III polyketide synthase [Pseudoclavibacter endophyticus]KAB1649469.1 type III polyketide synthase [Pseudoclavibacter endophyticus]GGA62376.1 naringenin-chalcone synthase [Pseudoclavibacter endophyticus]